MTSRNLTSNFVEFRTRAVRDRSFHADDQVRNTTVHGNTSPALSL